MNSKHLEEIFHGEKPRKSQLTKIKIMDAYLELMRDQDFNRITATSIAERAKITRTTFYAYFEDTYAIMDAMEDGILTNMPFFKADPSKIIIKDIRQPPDVETCKQPEWYSEWFDYINSYREQLRIITGPHGDPQFIHRIRKHITASIDGMMDQDHRPHDSRRDYYLKAVSNMQILLAKDWIEQNDSSDATSDDLALLMNTIRIGAFYLEYLGMR